MVHMKFPTINLPELFHVGTMDRTHRKFESYEGAGLSVSTEPHAWMRITPLPGEIHTLRKKDGTFLHYRKLKKSYKDVIKTWGIENGYVEEGYVYNVCYYDDEFEMELCSVYRDREKALEEVDEDHNMRKMNSIFSTPKMDERVRNKETNSNFAMEMLASIYSEDVLGLDGVWWADKLDVMRLSAPRGCIFEDKMSSWAITVEG